MSATVRRSCIGACVAAAALLAGCTELLPKSRTETASAWTSFDEARSAIERIVPYTTTKADLNRDGVDPYRNPNITLLTYSDVILRFPIGASVPSEKLDRGIRDCLYAGQACYGYAIAVRDIRHDRTANFWLDSLNFQRIVDTNGWSFNALILLVDGTVVYKLYGGQPLIKETEDNRQPLGPLQDWGSIVPGFIKY